jgi:hypothetical protein
MDARGRITRPKYGALVIKMKGQEFKKEVMPDNGLLFQS